MRRACFPFARFVAIGCVGIAACGTEPSGLTPDPRPDFIDVRVEPGPHNVLTLVVSAAVTNADSAAILFRATRLESRHSITPTQVVYGDSVVVPVFGLRPETDYSLHVLAWGRAGSATSRRLDIRTGSLPPDLPHFEAGGPDPSPGFIVFAAGDYGLVIDNSGRVVWYRWFPGGPGLNFMTQSTGHYVVRPPSTDPADVEPWVELDAIGNVVRTLGCARGLRARFHDLITVQDGSYWLMCDETRTWDLTAIGGSSLARVTGTVVQHVSAGGTVLFEWSAFDHFNITDLPAAERSGDAVNWTHGNAIAFDADGNLLVSFRSLNEVTKIDVSSGEVIWRLGGLRNEFTFSDTPMPAFIHQHGVRVTAGGDLLLLDNTGDPNESRAERFAIDASKHNARLESSLGAGIGVVTPIGGSVQDLPGGRTLVAFGVAGRVAEFDADGRVVWRIDGNAGYVFRAQRIRSLYAPGTGETR